MAIRIYIDQGHNPKNYNTGAEGNGYFEQDITFDIGLRLYLLFLENPAFLPRLSRPTAETVLGTSNSTSLTARVNEANAFGADLFLSLHTNAASDPSATGAEALVYSTASTAAYNVAGKVLASLTAATGLRDRGILARPDLYVLRRTKMPAVLIEMGFITNARDAALMADSPDLFAAGIYRGVLRYYGLL